MDSDLSRIIAKLGEVRERRLKSFGSQSHRFRLEKPYREEKLRGFEERHGIALPDDFRRFVLQAGSSGAAPYYGLLPMERWVHFDDDRLGADCRMQPEEKLTDEEVEARDKNGSLTDGTITIVSCGGSQYVLLVITGPHRGRVIEIDLENVDEPSFTSDAGFLAWYERWLDYLLAEIPEEQSPEFDRFAGRARSQSVARLFPGLILIGFLASLVLRSSPAVILCFILFTAWACFDVHLRNKAALERLKRKPAAR